MHVCRVCVCVYVCAVTCALQRRWARRKLSAKSAHSRDGDGRDRWRTRPPPYDILCVCVCMGVRGHEHVDVHFLMRWVCVCVHGNGLPPPHNDIREMHVFLFSGTRIFAPEAAVRRCARAGSGVPVLVRVGDCCVQRRVDSLEFRAGVPLLGWPFDGKTLCFE